VIDGRRRLAAARALALKAIPAMIVSKPDVAADVLAAEANRRGNGSFVPVPAPVAVPVPEPVPCAPPVSVNPLAPSPGWRSDWRLPAAFAVVAVLALLAGVGGGLAGRSVIVPEVERAAPARSDAAVPAASTSSDPAEGVRQAEPSVPVAPASEAEPQPPAWAEALSVDGVETAVADGSVLLTFREPVFARYATMTPQAATVLRALAQAVAHVEAPIAIVVHGHTDDAPVRAGAAYHDNYALGLARATRVVQFLRYESGLTNVTLSAASQGDVDPPFPNDTPADRLRNRTVTLEVVAE
jgi:outer membrane protein OmpA-like peptidoglycan-associated protein